MAAPPRKRISSSSSGALWPCDGLGSRAAFFFTVIMLAAGCTVIFGVDDLVFRDQSSGGTGGTGGSTGGTGGDGGSTSGTGGTGGSTSGTGGTGGSTGDVCLDCVYTSCGNELESCLNDADCFGIDCSCCYAAINDDSCMGYPELEGVNPTTGECTDDTASCGLYNALGACVCVASCSSECSDMCG